MTAASSRSSPEARDFGRRLVLVAIACLFALHDLPAQERKTSQAGISGIGALGAHIGGAAVERSVNALEAGALIDLGWTGAPRLRLQGEIEFLRATITRFVALEDRTFSGPFFDLSTSVSLVLLGGNEHQRLVPYLTAGVGVHALSSAFGVLELDRLYNANPFGIYGGGGFRFWLSATGRSGMFLEGRHVLAENVDRTSARLGLLVFYRDLIRPRG